MTNIDSCAQARISFYEVRFQSETTEQLVNDFNTLAASRGWTSERSYFSHALIKELQRRGVDLSAISYQTPDGELSSISYRPIRYDANSHALILVG